MTVSLLLVVAGPSVAKTTTKESRAKLVRACRATTLPTDKADKAAQSVDVDRDGADDLVVVNWHKREVRIAINGGAEVAVPMQGYGGGLGRAAIVSGTSLPGVFGIRTGTSSIGFQSAGTVLMRRSGCRLDVMTLDGAPFTLKSTTLSASFGTNVLVELRCVGGRPLWARQTVELRSSAPLRRWTLEQRDLRLVDASFRSTSTPSSQSVDDPATLALPGVACLTEEKALPPSVP